MIDNGTKQQISQQLHNYCENYSSDNKASTALGISNAYVSQIKNGKWDAISDDMWRKVGKLVGYSVDEGVIHANTRTYEAITKCFDNSRLYSNVFAGVAKSGSGKTYTLDRYRQISQNVFYYKCKRSTTPKEFLSEIMRSMGKGTNTTSIAALLRQLENLCERLELPIIIIDEIEKTRNDILYLTIDLYNTLHRKAGIVYLGTPYFKDRIETGAERGRMCFPEMLSRFGGKFIEFPAANAKDAGMIIRANGINNEDQITEIINDSSDGLKTADLRRVDRLIHKHKLEN
jgi:hypothetical protein